MEEVRSEFKKGNVSESNQAKQRQIILELGNLLATAPSEAQNSESKDKSNQNGKQETVQAGNDSNQDVQNTSRNGEKSDNDVGPREVPIKIWGHLPEKLRNQMKNVQFERFVPKYSDLIREYYKRLAEQPDR